MTITNQIKEPYNQCRQILPKTYLHNGYIDILNTEMIEKGTISGTKIYPYIMNKIPKICDFSYYNFENM